MEVGDDMSICDNIIFMYILKYINLALQIGRIVIPIGLIVKIVLDIYKQIIDINDNSGKEKITKRVVAAVIVFLIPTIVNVFLSLISNVTGQNIDYKECDPSDENIKLLVSQAEYKSILEDAERTAKIREDQLAFIEKAKLEAAKSGQTDQTAIRIGTKYNVSDSELENIAKVCQREQGTPAGAAAEAELMINKYILSGYEGSFYDYLFKSSKGNWWAPIVNNTFLNTILKPEVKEAVRKVVVEGQRTMPAYINEHDCMDCNKKRPCANGNPGDICYLEVNGQKYSSLDQIKQRDNKQIYVSETTKIYTVYKQDSSVKYWVFYSFPDSRSDPFGYEPSAKAKILELNK